MIKYIFLFLFFIITSVSASSIDDYLDTMGEICDVFGNILNKGININIKYLDENGLAIATCNVDRSSCK